MKISTHNNLYLLLLTFAATALLGACKPIDTEETIRSAEHALSYGNVETAASNCDLLADTTNNLSPTQLCRVAIMYAKISEKTEMEDYMAAAAECLDRAMVMDNDTIDLYIESLDIEDQSYVRTIREVTHALNYHCDISKEDDYDCEEADFDITYAEDENIDTVSEKPIEKKTQGKNTKKTKKARKSARQKNTAAI